MEKIIKALIVLNIIAIAFGTFYSYKTHTHFEVVALLSASLIALFFIDFYYPSVKDTSKRVENVDKAIKEAIDIKTLKAELDIANQEIEALKKLIKDILSTVEESVLMDRVILQELQVEKINSFQDIINQIKDEKLRKEAYQVPIEDKQKIAEAFVLIERLKKMDKNSSISMDDVAMCVLYSKNCFILDALKFAVEKGIKISKFLEKVNQLAQEDEFEYKQVKYKAPVFKDGDCVYVNFAVLKSVFPQYLEDKENSDKYEKYFAALLKDYLCESINWEKGFVKNIFSVKEGEKESKRPLIALKSQVVKNIKQRNLKVG